MKKLLVVLSAALLAVALSCGRIPGPLPRWGLECAKQGGALPSGPYCVREVLIGARASHPVSGGFAHGRPLLHGQGGAAAAASAGKSNGGVQTLQSVNWSGYADVDASASSNPSAPGTLSGVSARWTLPYVSCPQGLYRNQDAFAAQWVGIDGAVNQTVEQLGTAEQCYEDVLYYYVWYEMFPAGTVQEGTQACINNNVDCPRPGDQISASVNVTPGTGGNNNYTLALSDYTTPGNNFSVSQPCAANVCLDQSAEWVMERPAFDLPFGFQILPLVDYFNDAFSNGTVVSNGKTSSIAGFQAGPVYYMPMTDDSLSYYLSCPQQFGPSGQLLLLTQANACPTVPPSRGGNFSVTWDSSF